MKTIGSFTLPGEEGYEQLTLELAKRWGADVIRDCDGTSLSKEILDAGFNNYSTLCIIRNHNDYVRNHQDFQQQTFLMSKAANASNEKGSLCISIMDGYFQQQFSINETNESISLWQVFDRTTNKEVLKEDWSYHPNNKTVEVKHVIPWHRYTVNFFAWRIWEEINMYNHITNNWQQEPLTQLDPRYPEVQTFMCSWLKDWCLAHPATDVVRFTSLFYNFVWIWGSDTRNRDLLTDWGSYDFTVSPKALQDFKQRYGYSLSSEDFINQGRRNSNHIKWNQRMKDYLSFINDFVVIFAKQLVDIVHSYGKQAYVFYDDSWVGMEPCGERFKEIGFDGIVKCVFSGFEARLCASVESVKVHELRLHPYLFPEGLGGSPTFKEGGNPALDARRYWINVRRALLRKPVDRIGLGGYLHLTKNFPDFVDTIEEISEEFRIIKELHKNGKPACLNPRILILSDWGKLRSWTCGGHYHEHPDLDLINILESLAGLPFNVEFEAFNSLTEETLENAEVIINAGFAGSSWSGGAAWEDDNLVQMLTNWVNKGGIFFGVNEPSQIQGYDTLFRMAHVLGIDEDDGRRLCEGHWDFKIESSAEKIVEKSTVKTKENIYLIDDKTQVLMANNKVPCITLRNVGEGKGIYLSSYQVTPENTRMLQNLIMYACEQIQDWCFTSNNSLVECSWFPATKQLVLLNNSDASQGAKINIKGTTKKFRLKPFEMRIESIKN